jgi:hypothetical protein
VGGFWIEKILYDFNPRGVVPQGEPTGVILDASGSLYGETSYTNENNSGIVFQLSPPSSTKGAWTENILYAFPGQESDGLAPIGGLVFDGTGSLYGVTLEGGQFSGGTVFQLTPPATQGAGWTQSVLYSFGLGEDSSQPISQLTFDNAGALYGVSEGGGTNLCGDIYDSCGTVFKLTPPSVQGGIWTEQVLHSFEGGADGADVQSPLLIQGTTVYGTTVEGGTGFCENQNGPVGCGTAFEITQP